MSHHRFQLLSLDDGSFTWVDTQNGQAMHSKLGAWKEATELYVQGSGLLNLPKTERPVCIWDVGMGTASNALSAIHHSDVPLHIISFENAPEALDLALRHPQEFPFLSGYEENIRELLKQGATSLSQKKTRWELRRGDFFQNLENLPAPDFIFWDFYAPQVVSELWGTGAFTKLRQAIPTDASGLLVTYASATAARVALMLAGFYVGVGPGTEAKKETTHAAYGNPSLLSHSLGLEWLEKMGRSSKPFPSDWKPIEGKTHELLFALKKSPHGQRFFKQS